MQKRHELVLGFLFATAIWAVAIVLQSESSAYYQICETNQNGQNSCTPHHVLYVVLWYVSYIFNAATITALATAAIAYFTLTLKRSTDKLWDASERQARLTKRTADIAERALVDLERPILQIIEPFQSMAHMLSDEPDAINTHYKIANFGRTPATLHEISIQFGEWIEPLPAPVYEVKIPTATVIPQGQTIPGKTQTKLPIRFYADKTHSFVFGYFRYSDIFGFLHIAGFGLRWDRDLKSWAISGGAAYNYQRIEREPKNGD